MEVRILFKERFRVDVTDQGGGEFFKPLGIGTGWHGREDWLVGFGWCGQWRVVGVGVGI